MRPETGRPRHEPPRRTGGGPRAAGSARTVALLAAPGRGPLQAQPERGALGPAPVAQAGSAGPAGRPAVVGVSGLSRRPAAPADRRPARVAHGGRPGRQRLRRTPDDRARGGRPPRPGSAHLRPELQSLQDLRRACRGRGAAPGTGARPGSADGRAPGRGRARPEAAGAPVYAEQPDRGGGGARRPWSVSRAPSTRPFCSTTPTASSAATTTGRCCGRTRTSSCSGPCPRPGRWGASGSATCSPRPNSSPS